MSDKNAAIAGKWVGTWAASPYFVTPDNMPPSPGLADNTLRQVIRVSIKGEKLRLKFSNERGDAPLTMNAVHLAYSDGGHAIKADTDQPITFDGKESVIIPAGQTVVSDTIDYSLDNLALMAITIHFGSVPERLTGHPGSRTNSYLTAGNQVDAESMPDAVLAERWYVITGIDVLTTEPYRAVVALGDSITDGRGTTTDKNNRWTDILANRLQAHTAAAQVGVLNQGIGGNALTGGGLGPSAVIRFDRDVLGQSGVRYLIVLEGVNDLGSPMASDETVAKMIQAYRDFIRKAHENNILIYGGTITPFGGSFYDNGNHDQLRQKVNEWIRTCGEFDAVIDFEEAVKDSNIPNALNSLYDSGDHLHLSPAGYQRMGECIDLELFTR